MELCLRTGRASAWFSRWRRQGLLSRFPDRRRRLDARHILQSELRDGGAEGRTVSIAGVRQYHSHRYLLLHRPPHLLQGNLRLGLKPNPFGNPGLSAPFGILAPHLRPTNSLPPGSYPASRFAHGTAERLLRNASLASETRCHPQSTPPRGRVSTSLAALPAAPVPASRRRPMVRPPPSDATTDACAEHCLGPSAQPSARRSCSLLATTIQCSSSSAVCVGVPRQDNCTSNCLFLTQ
jgi:hypothetical protein